MIRLLSILVVASFFVTPALAADVTIPINKYHVLNKTMRLNIINVFITEKAWAGTFTDDVENTSWPKLVYTYENIGKVPDWGRFHMAFIDENGKVYPKEDFTKDPIYPGNSSSVRFLEAAVPKGVKVTRFVIYKGNTTIIDAEYEIPYAQAATPTPVPEDGPKRTCLIFLIMPLLVIGTIFISKRKHP
jgi:hypothetical protein